MRIFWLFGHERSLVVGPISHTMETAPRNQTSFPLHEAVESGNLEVLKTLLDNGGNINVQNDRGETLLHVAVNKNDHQSQELLTLLLERGANPRLRNRHKESPLICALNHNPKCVPLILRNGSGKDTVDIPDGQGNYPLHYALENETVLKMLLDNGAFIESTNNQGQTALHLASSKNHVLLHDKPIAMSGNEENYLSFLQNASDVYYNVTNQLLMHGAEVNSKDSNGRTPLHMTSDIKRVRLLLDKGALVNSRDNRGKTPLHKATGVSYDVANELLIQGAEVNTKDNYGNTPLHTSHNINFVRFLLEKGALVNSRNSSGKTPLHRLSMYDRDKAYELLLHGADVNSKDNYGNTPLHMTCLIERQRNAEVNREDLWGRIVLDDLENTGHMTYFYVANIMLDWGASLTVKDKRGRTPSDIYPKLLDWAKPHNVRKSCVKLLDIPCEELELKSYWISCLEEAARLKLARFGKNSLYDIFGQCSDPIFLSNERLKKSVELNDYKKEFPIYCYLLQSTYKLAEKRLYILEDAADTLQTPLPREITWYILTFVDDDSLRNLIRAKDAK